MKPNSDYELQAAAGSTECKSSFLRLRRQLREEIRDIRELPDGYDFMLLADPAPILKVIQFLSLERLSFRFLRIAVTPEPDKGTVWLRVTGSEDLKEFLRGEFFSGGSAVDDGDDKTATGTLHVSSQERGKSI